MDVTLKSQEKPMYMRVVTVVTVKMRFGTGGGGRNFMGRSPSTIHYPFRPPSSFLRYGNLAPSRFETVGKQTCASDSKKSRPENDF